MIKIITAAILALGIPMAAQTTSTSINGVPNQTITGQAVVPPQYVGPQAISGCGVEYVSGLTYTVGACLYSINGVTYNSPLTNITLATADPSNPRIDVIFVDATQVVQTIAGTPASSPQQPTVDPSTQLALTFVLVPTASSTPGNETLVDIYLEGTEWTPAKGGTSSANVNLTSTNNPYQGTKDVEFGAGGTVATTTFSGFTDPSAGTVQLQNYNNLVFYLRNKAAWPTTRSITIQWYSGATLKGSGVVINNGAFGFNATTNTATYQQISIPVGLFGIAGIPVTSVRLTVSGTGTNLTGFYMDEMTLQGGIGSGITLPTTLMNFKGTWSASNAYLANDTVVSGGVGYVALVANTNTAVSTTATWAALGGGGGASTAATYITADGTGTPPTNYQVATAGSGISVTPNAGAHTLTITNTGSFADPASAQIFIGDSRNIVANINFTTATAISCNGTICTVTDTQSSCTNPSSAGPVCPNYTAGQWVQFSSASSPACIQFGLGQVLASGLSGSSFQVTENALGINATCSGTVSGTGGSVQDATYFYPQQTGALPFFKNHGNLYNYGVSGGTIDTFNTNFTAWLAPLQPDVTGHPAYNFIQAGSQNALNCDTATTIEGKLQTLWASMHTHQGTVIQETLIPVTGTIFCNSIYIISQVNLWLPSQIKDTANTTSGKYIDRLIDVATSVPNAFDFTRYGDGTIAPTDHLNDYGAASIASYINLSFATQGSTIPSPIGGVMGQPLFVDVTASKSLPNTAGVSGLGIGVFSNKIYSGGTSGFFGLGVSQVTSIPYLSEPYNTRAELLWKNDFGITVNNITPWPNGYCFNDGQFDVTSRTTDACMRWINTKEIGFGNASSYTDVTAQLDFANLKMATTAPSGACAAGLGGVWELTQDGAITRCPSGGGTWTTFAGGSSGTVNTGIANHAAYYASNTNAVSNAANNWFSATSVSSWGALPTGASGTNNTASGAGALAADTTGSNNTADGNNCLAVNTTGVDNTCVGSGSLNLNLSASQNTAGGKGALAAATTSPGNSGWGDLSLSGITTGTGLNAALGYQAGSNATTNDNSLFLGVSSQPSTTSGTNEVVVGPNTTGNGSNTTTIGNGSTTDSYIAGTLHAGGTGHSIVTGTASNTDLAGQITLSGGTGTYSFAGTYATAPICVASDTTATNAVKASASTTTLTLTGTSTDVINYICIGRT